MKRKFALAITLAGFMALPAFADDVPGGIEPGKDMRLELPPQAYKACQGKKEGDTVLFTNKNGRKIPATCVSSSKGLIALPQRHD